MPKKCILVTADGPLPETLFLISFIVPAGSLPPNALVDDKSLSSFLFFSDTLSAQPFFFAGAAVFLDADDLELGALVAEVEDALSALGVRSVLGVRVDRVDLEVRVDRVDLEVRVVVPVSFVSSAILSCHV